MVNFSIGLIVHRESIQTVQACLSSLEQSLKISGCEAELVCIYTDFSPGSLSSEKLDQQFFSQFKQFSKIVLIPILELQNSITFKRNLALNFASGKYLYFTDPDVVHSESMFKAFLSQLALLQNEKCFGLTGPFKQKSESLFIDVQVRALSFVAQIIGLSYQGVKSKSKKLDHAPCAHLFLNKEKVKTIGGFSESLENVGEDLDLSHRITKSGGHYSFTTASATHRLPGIFESYKKFFNYGRAQVQVQIQNGPEFIRWYRLVPLFAGVLMLTSGIIAPIFLGPGFVFSISILGIYFFGMLTAIVNEILKRTRRFQPLTNVAK